MRRRGRWREGRAAEIPHPRSFCRSRRSCRGHVRTASLAGRDDISGADSNICTPQAARAVKQCKPAQTPSIKASLLFLALRLQLSLFLCVCVPPCSFFSSSSPLPHVSSIYHLLPPSDSSFRPFSYLPLLSRLTFFFFYPLFLALYLLPPFRPGLVDGC